MAYSTPSRYILPIAWLICLAVASPTAGQTLRGQVVDKTTQLPLPGANVLVLESDPLRGTTTDTEGWFVLDGLLLGRHDLSIRYIGYEPVLLPNILVTTGKEVVLHVTMKEQSIAFDEVVVTPDAQKDQPLNDLAFISARSFSVEETRRYAGGVDDPARMASAFAGIAAGGDIQTNALVIRGNAPKGVLWRLEGVEIPNPNHFAGLSVAGGGGLTLFSSHLLADSDLFTGAFPAEYGNALAGVFDMRFRNGHPTRREHAAQVGVLGVEVASEGPIVLQKPATYLFNYRYSTIGLLLPILPTEDVATYQDLSFKLNVPRSPVGRFAVWGIGGLDRQTGTAKTDSTQWEYETWDRLGSDLNLRVGAAGINHDLILGRGALLRSTVAATINQTLLDQQRISDELILEDDLKIHNTQGSLIGSTSLSRKFGARHVNRTGLSVQWLFYDLDLRNAPDPTSPLIPIVNDANNSALVRVYTQSKFDLFPRWSVHAGIHVQHFALTGQSLLEPRAGIRWTLSEGQVLSAGYGLHSQTEDLRLYLVERPSADGPVHPNKELRMARAHHFVLGYDLNVGERARVKLEPYAQLLFDVPVIADSSYSLLNFEQDYTFDDPLVNTGRGENFGVDLTLERFLHDGYYYLFTGSVFSSRYRGGDGIWRHTRFDRGYTANGLFGKEFSLRKNDLLGMNGRLSFVGGQRRSPVDVASSLEEQEVIYDERNAFSERDRNLFLIDLTLTYRRNHRRYSAVWALQIKNVLGEKEIYPDYNFRTRTVDEVKEGFPLPVLSYKIEF